MSEVNQDFRRVLRRPISKHLCPNDIPGKEIFFVTSSPFYHLIVNLQIRTNAKSIREKKTATNKTFSGHSPNFMNNRDHLWSSQMTFHFCYPVNNFLHYLIKRLKHMRMAKKEKWKQSVLRKRSYSETAHDYVMAQRNHKTVDFVSFRGRLEWRVLRWTRIHFVETWLFKKYSI